MCFLSFPIWVAAQDELSPDVKKMQESARSYLERNDFDNAIMMYSQAIRLAPSNVVLRRDLAYTYYLSGNDKKAKEIIDPVVQSSVADEQAYQIAIVIYTKLKNSAKAKRLINEGLTKFPSSGVLYNTKGNMLQGDKKSKDALEAYNKGIKSEPEFANNYYSAAKLYYSNNNPVWALIYGEIYLNLDPFSAKTIDIKKQMIDAYRMLLSPTEGDALPDFNTDDMPGADKKSFTAAFKQTMQRSAPAIVSGLNTESLTMLRTRFMIAWSKDYAALFPFTLFTYQDKMLRNGIFDAYNQWLFGAADNSAAFSQWVKAHANNYTDFEQWRKLNPLQPAAYDPKANK